MQDNALVPTAVQAVALTPKPSRKDLINAMVERRLETLAKTRKQQNDAKAKKADDLNRRLGVLAAKHSRALIGNVSLGWENGPSVSGVEVTYRISANWLKQADASLHDDLCAYHQIKTPARHHDDKRERQLVRAEVVQALGGSDTAEGRVEKILANDSAVAALDEVLARIYKA